MGLLVRDRTMFDPARHDDEFAFLDPDVPITKLHAKAALDDQEEFVLVVVAVPEEWPWNLTSLTCWPFNSPTIFGCQCSLNRENFSRRLILSMSFLHCHS